MMYKFTAPKDGIYKLETWGAQGGNAYLEPDTSKEYDGGYGAYSTGIINLKKRTNYLYYCWRQGKNGTWNRKI